jgi:hypothetical protein
MKKFKFDELKPSKTPMETIRDSYLKKYQKNLNHILIEIIVSLMYIATAMRPDIAYTVGQLNRFCDMYSKSLLGVIKRLFRYLKGTSDFGITYQYNSTNELKLGIQLTGFCDSGWADDPTTS